MPDKEVSHAGGFDYAKGDYIYIFTGGTQEIFRVVESTRTTLSLRGLRWYERLWLWLQDLRGKFCDWILGGLT